MKSLKSYIGDDGSIRRRLPLLACTVLLVATTAVVVLAYDTVTNVLLDAGQARALGASEQLAALLETSSHARMTEVYAVARSARVRAAVRDGTDDSRARARGELESYLAKSTQVLGVQLWNATGHSALTVARSHGSVAPATTGLTAFGVTGSVVYYDIVVPVFSIDIPSPHAGPTASTIGHLVVRRRATTPAVAQMIKQLIGDGATFLVGTRGGVWTDLETIVADPEFNFTGKVTTTGIVKSRRGTIAVVSPVRGTPWTLLVTLPEAVALAPASDFLTRIVPFGSAVVIAAGVVVWLIMGSITRPLNELTEAAETISARNYQHLLLPPRSDEIGRLTDAFNVMSDRIHRSHMRLEERVRERTNELENALKALKVAQEQVVRREKLAVLGQLAGGVGHELRNPLGVMTNAVYYLDLVQPEAPDDVREYHEILRAQIGLAEKIIGDLLDFARVKPPERVQIPLVAIVEQQLHRLHGPSDIVIAQDFPVDLPLPRVDPVQIGQVVFNLLANAVQAMETTGGTLSLCGRNDTAGEVALVVSDSGPGVPEDARDRVFEPLVSTKPRGIGLGLAVSRSLTEANGGTLVLADTRGPGATFILTIPTACALEVAA